MGWTMTHFKIGDRVREVTMDKVSGRVGTVGESKGDFPITVIFDEDPTKYKWGYHQGTEALYLIERRRSTKLDVVFTISDLPQVEAIMTEAREAIQTLTAEREEARDQCRRVMEFFPEFGCNDPETLMARLVTEEGFARGFGAACRKSAQGVKLNLDEEQRYSAHERERAEAAERDARLCAQERDEALEKLDDIDAILRTGRLMDAAKVDDPSLIDTMESVLRRSSVRP